MTDVSLYSMDTSEAVISTMGVPPSPAEQARLIRAASLPDSTTYIPDVVERYRGVLDTGAIVDFDAIPFASGGQRLAFHGDMQMVSVDNGEVETVPVVVKLELATAETIAQSPVDRTQSSKVAAARTLRRHSVAASFIDKWHNLGVSKTIVILEAQTLIVTQVPDIDSFSPRALTLYTALSLSDVLYEGAVGTCEDFVPGRFTKFLNNDGVPCPLIKANFASAFAHWSWVVSRATVMISDIQGVRSPRRYVLTDPALHSAARPHVFGDDDLGPLGVRAFFEHHVCNSLCRDLGLLPCDNISLSPPSISFAPTVAPLAMQGTPRSRMPPRPRGLSRSRLRSRSRSRSHSRLQGPVTDGVVSHSDDDASFASGRSQGRCRSDGVAASLMDGFPPTRVNPADVISFANRHALIDVGQIHISPQTHPYDQPTSSTPLVPTSQPQTLPPVMAVNGSYARRKRAFWFFSKRASLKDVMEASDAKTPRRAPRRSSWRSAARKAGFRFPIRSSPSADLFPPDTVPLSPSAKMPCAKDVR